MQKFTKWDLLAVLIISLVPGTIEWIRYFFFDHMPTGSHDDVFTYFCMGTLYSFVVTFSLYFGCLTIFHWLNEKFPWKDHAAIRIPLEIFLIFTYATLAQLLILLMFGQTTFFEKAQTDARFYFENIFFGNTVTLIVISMVEGVYFFRRWKESLLLAEKMKSENMASQLNSLKAQLDPHFLFNSLNVLASLIKKDTTKAELFVEDFARVYRYVLDVKDEMVVTLSSEFKFLESYTNLQKIRFGNSLRISVQVNPRPMTLFLPPLSLQELVSNAVKHNEVSREKPLKIEIYNKGDELIVRNNFQHRDDGVVSTGVGLENIAKRYALLSDKEPVFEVAEGFFVARLPLLEIED